MDTLLQQMLSKRAIDGPERQRLRLSEFDAHVNTVTRMCNSGFIVKFAHEFGEKCIALRKEGLSWVSRIAVEKPTILTKAFNSSAKPWKRSKLELALRLLDEGFEPGVQAASLYPAGAPRFAANWLRPWSYFAALFCRQDIWEKSK